MDLSSILKTVISLADVVIKKPSTSVQNSGIDLSSIISMASIFMGGKNNNSSAGGLGSILGSALGSGALGGLLGVIKILPYCRLYHKSYVNARVYGKK
ncbi:MAG: hypothetical protein IIT37_12470 [Bacteroidales bacterium]|nr:hypothetical protein [Bacteroidales bacterium]